MTNEITVRLAVDSEASQIGNMVTKMYGTDMTWDRVYPYWLVAEDKTGILACIQVLIGLPSGAIEFLSFRDNLSPVRKAYAIKKLSTAALAALQNAGCAVAFGIVPQGIPSWRRTLKRKWNANILERACNLFFKRLR